MSTAKIIPIILLLLSMPLFFIRPGLAQVPPAGPPERPPAAGPSYIPGEILVKFRPVAGRPNQLQLNQHSLLNAMGATPLEMSAYSGVMRVNVPPGREADIIATLQARGDVAFAHRNQILQALGTPNDPEFTKLWGLDQIDAPDAWDIETGAGGQVIIAVIDSGADLDHPDLAANLIPGFNFLDTAAPPEDDTSHGTHVAGIAAAVGDNGQGVTGLSWGSKIMPLKILDGGSLFDLADAIYYAVDNEADIINMSLGASGSDWPCNWTVVEDAFDYAVDQGVLLVAASGNDYQNGVNCPAAYDQVIAVGSTTSSDTRSTFSNYGTRLDVVAPGDDIYSTIPVGQDDYDYKAGTSMATPYVSGLAALLWSYAPNLQDDEIRSIIESSADDLGAAGFDPYFGHGRINARRALESLVNFSTQAAQTGFFLDDSQVNTTGTLQLLSATTEPITWTATVSPTVSWLGLSATSGTLSAATSPTNLTMTLTRPANYGVYSATVIISGTHSSGLDLGTRSTGIQLTYSPVQLQLAPAPVNLAIDDNTAEPLIQTLQLTSTAQAPVTWTATISPTVPWLALNPPAGLTSASTGVTNLDLSATRPVTYGLYNTELLITGLNSVGQVVDTQTVPVTINYAAEPIWYYYFPFILKNYGNGSNTTN